MALNGCLSLAVRRRDDVLWVRQEARRFLDQMSFSPEELERLGLIVSELATNLVKHAGGGRLTMTRIEREGAVGVSIVSTDHGPGIADLAKALTAGFSTSGTHGDGLITVRELSDKFELTTLPGSWTRVEVEKWVR